MTKPFYLQIFTVHAILSFTSGISAQQDRTRWKSAAFDNKVFIENKGQHDGIVPLEEPVLFTIDNAGEFIFFTAHGMHVGHPMYFFEGEKPTPLRPVSGKEFKKDDLHVEWTITSMQWNKSNEVVHLYGQQQADETFAFAQGVGHTIHSNGYKELVYENVYPGIDVHYTFHHECGLKYNIHVHPGADASQIEMKYTATGNIALDGAGDIYIPTPAGSIIDHSPVSYYASDGAGIRSSFKTRNNEVNFALGEYDETREVIIDPWVISPGFTNTDVATDVERNPATGEIYVFGGTPAHQIRKFDSDGNPVWTYTTAGMGFGNYYGDIDLGPDGNLYYSDGCCTSSAYKLIESTQTIAWTYIGIGEPWRMEYNETTDELILAGYGFNIPQQNVDAVNPNTGVNAGMGAVASNNGLEMEEIRTITIAPDGRLFSLHCSPYLSITPQSNRISCADLDFTMLWQQESGFLLPEEGAHYAYTGATDYCADYQCFHGINGIVTSADFVFSSDGDKLIKRNIIDGGWMAEVDVNSGEFQECSGLVTDSCQFVYAGTLEGVNQYNQDLEIINTYATGAAVYDLVPGVPGEMIVCGDGFLASIAMDCGLFASLTATNPECFGECTGTATVEIFGGTDPYDILWSNGETTNTVENLCAGTYTVTITDDNEEVDVQEINITSPSIINVTGSANEPGCFNDCDGSLSVSASGGVGSYSYTWNTTPVQNSATATDLCTGNYSSTITDANGCTQLYENVLDQPSQLNVNVDIQTCTDDLPNGTATANVSGGTSPYTYSWTTTPQQNTQVAIDLYTGIYSVHV
ncbi:MAG: hypothetical protein SH856_14960 [Flavobacteriales bacterium]|nr:hypothetical protein [Flavobacteriales bacterium]